MKFILQENQLEMIPETEFEEIVLKNMNRQIKRVVYNDDWIKNSRKSITITFLTDDESWGI